MRNIGLALLVGMIAFLGLYLPHVLKASESLVPAILLVLISYAVFAKRSFQKLEQVFTEAGSYLQSAPPKFDIAIATIQKAYPLAKEQFGIRTQLDTQIGVIFFLQKDFNKALSYLKRSVMFGHWMGGAMLAVIHYKKKNYPEMRKIMDIVTKRAKKQGLAWSLYAYLLVQIGEPDAAIKILTSGTQYAKEDTRLGESLLALQNGKKMKMRNYKEQWYQFHLEQPPAAEYAQQQMAGSARMSRQARRGRW